MADTDKDRGWLSALVDKEVKDEFAALAKSMHMDASKLLRLIVDEKLEEARHVKKIANRVEKKIRQVAR